MTEQEYNTNEFLSDIKASLRNKIYLPESIPQWKVPIRTPITPLCSDMELLEEPTERYIVYIPTGNTINGMFEYKIDEVVGI